LPAPSLFELSPERPVSIEVFGRSVVICLPGDLDNQDDGHLAEVIDYAIRCGHHRLVLDLTAATHLDCSSYRSILRGLQGLQQVRQSAVVVAGASGPVRRMLHVLEADLIFTEYPSRGAALAALRDPSRPPNDGWRTIAPPALVPPRVRAIEPEPAPDWLPATRSQAERVPVR
jgi:anti-anti-sigma factor